MKTATTWLWSVGMMSMLGASCVSASIIASAGFNDASGMNSDATPNSPYTLGQTVAGRGLGEPGWAGGWVVQNGGAQGGDPYAIVQNSAAIEGDGGLALIPGSFGSTRPIRTLAQPLSSEFILSQSLNFGSVGDVISGPFQHFTSQGDHTGPQWRLTGAVGSRHFEVFDGHSDQSGNWVNTGIAQKPGQWQQVVLDINVPLQTFKFSVDGVMYNAPHPTGFQNSAAVIDNIDYLTSGAGSIDAIVVSTVPEPTSIVLLGAVAILGLRRKRQVVQID
jgi:hypothetical protein